MKLRRFLGGLFFGLGCVVAFIGLLSAILPLIHNDQLQLVLSSFAMPSHNVVVNAFNAAMTYSLGNCYIVMGGGAGLILVGLLLMIGTRDSEDRPSARATRAQSAKREAYAVVADGATPAPVPVWQSSPREEPNPFADTTIADLLTPKAAPKANEAANPFAQRPILASEPVAVQEAPIEAFEAYKPDRAKESTFAPEKPVEAVPVYVPQATRASEPERVVEPMPVPVPTAPQPVQSMSERLSEALPDRASYATAPVPVTPVREEPQVIYRSPSLQVPHASAEPRIRSTFRLDAEPFAASVAPTTTSAAPTSASAEPAPVAASVSAETAATPVPVDKPASGRIKSTMGKHH